MTFVHRVAYLGGVCCRRLLFSAVRLPNGYLVSANSVFYLAVGISVNPICSVEGLYFGGEDSPFAFYKVAPKVSASKV